MSYPKCQRIIAYTADGSNITEGFASFHFNVPASITDQYNPNALFAIQFNAQGRRFFHQHVLIVLKDYTMIWVPQAFDVLAKFSDLPSTIVPPLHITSIDIEKKFDPSGMGLITEMEIDNVDGLPTYKMRILDTLTFKIWAKKAFVMPPQFADQILNFNVALAACDPGHSAWFDTCDATFTMAIAQGGMKSLLVGAPDYPASYTLPNGDVRSGFVTFEGSNLYQQAGVITDGAITGNIGVGPFV